MGAARTPARPDRAAPNPKHQGKGLGDVDAKCIHHLAVVRPGPNNRPSRVFFNEQPYSKSQESGCYDNEKPVFGTHHESQINRASQKVRECSRVLLQARR